jgi:predicted small lipoprotein YifL
MTTRAKLPVTLLALALVACGLTACGVRGPLEPPPEAVAEGQTKSAEAGAAGENSAAKPKPHEPFILDPLLR